MAVDVFQLNDFEVDFGKDFGIKKIRRAVEAFKDFLFVVGNDRRKLVHIADKNHLHAAKNRARLGAVNFEKGVDAVEQVGAEHGYFINENRVQIAEYAEAARFDFQIFDFGNGDVDGKIKKAVNRLAFNIEGGDSRRGDDDQVFGAVLVAVVEQGGFAGAGFSGNEKVVRRVVDYVHCPAEFGIYFKFGSHRLL